LRDAARHGTGIFADARQVQPLLALAAALVDLRQLGEAEDILRTADNPVLDSIPAQAALSLLRARIHLAGGRLAEAIAAARAALAVARTLGAHGYAAAAHAVLAMIELRRGDLAAADQHLTARPAAGPQFADLYARAETILAEAQVTEARAGPAAALGHLRQLCADLEDRPGLLAGDPAVAPWLARTALAAGEAGLAASAARAAQTLADAHPGFPALAAAAAHSRGLATRDPDRLAQAATRHPDPWARASAAEDLGVLHATQGDRDQVIGHLKDALSGYRQVGADRDQARVRRRLRQLGIRRRHWATAAARPVAGWDSLTGTEQAVAGLVAEGLNNNQVAARMYISTHTVAHHLRQAFRKLSIASRYELTRIVIEQAADGPAQLALLVAGGSGWFRSRAITADYHAVPQVFFCDPPAGGVGLIADQAERAGYRIRVIDVGPGQAVPDAGLYADSTRIREVSGEHSGRSDMPAVRERCRGAVRRRVCQRVGGGGPGAGWPGTGRPCRARRHRCRAGRSRRSGRGSRR
jgi:DNA-binding CsgD family transcriptional regulator